MEGKTPYNQLLCICPSSTLTNLGITVVLRIEQIVIPACWSIGVTLLLKLSKINLYYHFRLFSSSPIIYKRQVEGRSAETPQATLEGEERKKEEKRRENSPFSWSSLSFKPSSYLSPQLSFLCATAVPRLCHPPLPYLRKRQRTIFSPATTKPRVSNQGHALTYTFVFGPPLFPHGNPKDNPNRRPTCHIK